MQHDYSPLIDCYIGVLLYSYFTSILCLCTARSFQRFIEVPDMAPAASQEDGKLDPSSKVSGTTKTEDVSDASFAAADGVARDESSSDSDGLVE
jgi:hypothetical protein